MTRAVSRHLKALSDSELLERERADRCEFMQLERDEPPSEGTTYRAIRVSRALLAAWQRWTESAWAARTRGLIHAARHDRPIADFEVWGSSK